MGTIGGVGVCFNSHQLSQCPCHSALCLALVLPLFLCHTSYRKTHYCCCVFSLFLISFIHLIIIKRLFQCIFSKIVSKLSSHWWFNIVVDTYLINTLQKCTTPLSLFYSTHIHHTKNKGYVKITKSCCIACTAQTSKLYQACSYNFMQHSVLFLYVSTFLLLLKHNKQGPDLYLLVALEINVNSFRQRKTAEYHTWLNLYSPRLYIHHPWLLFLPFLWHTTALTTALRYRTNTASSDCLGLYCWRSVILKKSLDPSPKIQRW